MKLRILCIFLILGIVLCGCAGTANSIVGTWEATMELESVQMENGEAATADITLTLCDDGTGSMKTSTSQRLSEDVQNFRYIFSEDTLAMKFDDMDAIVNYNCTGDKLTLEEGAFFLEFTRVD